MPSHWFQRNTNRESQNHASPRRLPPGACLAWCSTSPAQVLVLASAPSPRPRPPKDHIPASGRGRGRRPGGAVDTDPAAVVSVLCRPPSDAASSCTGAVVVRSRGRRRGAGVGGRGRYLEEKKEGIGWVFAAPSFFGTGDGLHRAESAGGDAAMGNSIRRRMASRR